MMTAVFSFDCWLLVVGDVGQPQMSSASFASSVFLGVLHDWLPLLLANLGLLVVGTAPGIEGCGLAITRGGRSYSSAKGMLQWKQIFTLYLQIHGTNLSGV